MNKKYNILYVDDEELTLQAFTGSMKQDYNILTAKSGKEGLRLLENNEVDVIITDQQMTGMTGVEFLQEAIKIKPKPNRILITAFSDIEAIKQAINQGKIFHYLQKPFAREKYKYIIDRAIKAYHLELENEHLKNKLIKKNEGLKEINEKLFVEIREKNEVLNKLHLSQVKLVESEKRLKDISYNIADWIWELDVKGKFSFASGKVKEILGYDIQDLLGKSPIEFIDKERIDKYQYIYDNAFANFEPIIDLEIWNINTAGKKVCLLTNGIPIFDNNQNFLGFRGVNKDITEQKIIDEKIRKSEEKFRGLMESSSDSILLVDEKNKIQQINKLSQKLFGYNSEELIGKDVEILIPQKIKAIHKKHRKNYMKQPLSRIMGQGLELKAIKKDGTEFPVEVSLSPLKTEEDLIISVTIRDISERKAVEQKIKMSEERLKEAQMMAKLGSWELDLVKNELYWSDEIYRILNFSPQSFAANYEVFIEAIHPEDRTNVEQTYQTHIKNQIPYNIEHRIKLKDGTIKYVAEQCYSEFDENGKVLKSIGTIQDITDKKLTEIELQTYRRNLEILVKERTVELEIERDKAQNYLDIVGVIILVLDRNENITLINKMGARTLGFSSEKELLGLNWYDNFISVEERDERRSAFGKLFEEDISKLFESENNILTKTGEEKLIAWRDTLLKDKNGNIIGVLSSGEDITLRKANEFELKERTNELEMFNNAMIDREMRIIELKEEINKLAQTIELEIPYPEIWKEKLFD